MLRPKYFSAEISQFNSLFNDNTGASNEAGARVGKQGDCPGRLKKKKRPQIK